MNDNWIIKKVKKLNPDSDYVFLENPSTKKFLDDILWNKVWLSVKKYINENYSEYFSSTDDDIDIISGKVVEFYSSQRTQGIFGLTLASQQINFRLLRLAQ